MTCNVIYRNCLWEEVVCCLTTTVWLTLFLETGSLWELTRETSAHRRWSSLLEPGPPNSSASSGWHCLSRYLTKILSEHTSHVLSSVLIFKWCTAWLVDLWLLNWSGVLILSVFETQHNYTSLYSAPPPLQVQRAEVLYFKINCPDKFSLDKFPILVYENEVQMDKFYAFPQYEYPGLTKVRIGWALPVVKSHYQLLSVSGIWDIRIQCLRF